MPASRNAYTFKEGLTMMAAKAVGVDPYLAAEAGENARVAINAIRNAAKTKTPKDRAGYIREAQNELRAISAAQHPKLVNALQAKLLALQGRGGDTAVAHVEPGEMVIPRAMLTPEVMHMIATEAQRSGIDPRKLLVGGRGSINPTTGAEEFGWFVDMFDGVGNKLRDIFGVQSAYAAEPPTLASQSTPSNQTLDVEEIPVKAREVITYPLSGDPAGIERYNNAVRDKAMNTIKNWEGERLELYHGPEGALTSGVGHLEPQNSGRKYRDSIEAEESLRNLNSDYERVASSLNDPRLQGLDADKRAALISLGFNVGTNRLQDSKAYNALVEGRYGDMAKEWSEFRMAYDPDLKRKVYVDGLENRRGDELDMFFGRDRLRRKGDNPIIPIPGGSLRKQ